MVLYAENYSVCFIVLLRCGRFLCLYYLMMALQQTINCICTCCIKGILPVFLVSALNIGVPMFYILVTFSKMLWKQCYLQD